MPKRKAIPPRKGAQYKQAKINLTDDASYLSKEKDLDAATVITELIDSDKQKSPVKPRKAGRPPRIKRPTPYTAPASKASPETVSIHSQDDADENLNDIEIPLFDDAFSLPKGEIVPQDALIFDEHVNAVEKDIFDAHSTAGEEKTDITKSNIPKTEAKEVRKLSEAQREEQPIPPKPLAKVASSPPPITPSGNIRKPEQRMPSLAPPKTQASPAHSGAAFKSSSGGAVLEGTRPKPVSPMKPPMARTPPVLPPQHNAPQQTGGRPVQRGNAFPQRGFHPRPMHNQGMEHQQYFPPHAPLPDPNMGGGFYPGPPIFQPEFHMPYPPPYGYGDGFVDPQWYFPEQNFQPQGRGYGHDNFRGRGGQFNHRGGRGW